MRSIKQVAALRQALWLAPILATVLCSAAGPATAAADSPLAPGTFEFIRFVYGEHDKALSDFLIGEIRQFVVDNPDGANTAEARYLLGQVYGEYQRTHESFATYMQYAFLYPDGAKHQEAIDAARRITAAEKDYKLVRDSFESTVSAGFAGKTAADREFAYLSFLADLGRPKLATWIQDEIVTFVAHHPGDPRVEELLATAAHVAAGAGEAREAVARYRKIEYLFPESPDRSLYRYQSATLLWDKLNSHLAAKELFESIAASDPTNEYAPRSLYQLARIKEQKDKDVAGALVDLRRIVDEYGDSGAAPDALLLMGELYTKKTKEYDAAIKVYDEFVATYADDPRGAEALVAAAELHEKKFKSYERAAEHYARVAELYPDDPEAPEMLMEAGDLCAKKLKNNELAVTYYQALIDQYPDHEQTQKAQKAIDKALED